MLPIEVAVAIKKLMLSLEWVDRSKRKEMTALIIKLNNDLIQIQSQPK